MFLRMISRWTRSAERSAASRRNFCAAVSAEGVLIYFCRSAPNRQRACSISTWLCSCCSAARRVAGLPPQLAKFRRLGAPASPLHSVVAANRFRNLTCLPLSPCLPASVVRFALGLTRKNAGKMNGFCLRVFLSHDSLYVHQAAGIDGRDVLRAGHGHAVSLLLTHGSGNGFKFGGKGSAEAATFVEAQHVHQLEAFHRAQKLKRLFTQFKFAQAMARSVISDAVREDRADIGHLHFLDQKFRELKRSPPEGNGLIMQRTQVLGATVARSLAQQLRIKNAHHGGARAGGADDGLCIAKDA